jgi:hypothetical protein
MREVTYLHTIFLRMDMVYYTYCKSIVYLCIHLFKWQVCCQLHAPIWPLASQYLWLSDVEDKTVHLSKCCWSQSVQSRWRNIPMWCDVLQGKSCPESGWKCTVASLLVHLGVCAVSLFEVFWNVLIASLWAFIIFIILRSVVLAVWCDLALSLVCVIKVALFAKASAVSLYAISQWPGIHCKTVMLVFVINSWFNFWHFWTFVVFGGSKLLIAYTANFESEGCMSEFIT